MTVNTVKAWLSVLEATYQITDPHRGEAFRNAAPVMADAIRKFREDYGTKVQSGCVVHPGNIRLPLGAGVAALPFAAL